jgi:two-component system sensor histidine kinase YesM
LKQYVSIQQFRFGDKFIVYYEIEEDLMEFQVFRLMLQPLVENSILHGVRHNEGRGYIKLKIFKRGGRVHFRVVDNGCGMTKEECEKLRNSMNTSDIHHIGLINVNSRLVLRFGKEASLIIRSKKGMGSAMEFSLPDN